MSLINNQKNININMQEFKKIYIKPSKYPKKNDLYYQCVDCQYYIPNKINACSFQSNIFILCYKRK